MFPIVQKVQKSTQKHEPTAIVENGVTRFYDSRRENDELC